MRKLAPRFWNPLPFAGRLLFTASIALVVAGLVMLYTSAKRDAEEARADLSSQLEAELRTLPPSLAELLVIGDFSTLKQTLDSYVRRANISHIVYRDASGVVLDSQDPPVMNKVPAWFVAWLGLADYVGSVPAEVGGRRYGTVEITLTAQHVINRAWSRLVQHLSILLLAIVLDFIGIWLVLRSGLKPLLALDAGALALEKGDMSVRIPLQGSPELRHSIAAFNRMADSLERLLDERRQAEEGLRRLNDTLEQRVAEEVAKNREKDHLLIRQSRLAAMGEMVHNIAHQWRQPINALGLVLANIKDAFHYGELDQPYLEDAVGNGQRLIQKMSATIDDFRHFFRPNKEMAPFNLLGALDEVKGILLASLNNHQIRIEEDVEGNVTALGYANEYAQVLLNLLNNAKEAIVERNTQGGRIRVRLTAEDGMAVVRVADNGGGIPEDVLPRIFDPYFTTKEKGSGIGLYMSKNIIENSMSGRIDVRNAGEGAEFTVAVPLAANFSIPIP